MTRSSLELAALLRHPRFRPCPGRPMGLARLRPGTHRCGRATSVALPAMIRGSASLNLFLVWSA